MATYALQTATYKAHSVPPSILAVIAFLYSSLARAGNNRGISSQRVTWGHSISMRTTVVATHSRIAQRDADTITNCGLFFVKCVKLKENQAPCAVLLHLVLWWVVLLRWCLEIKNALKLKQIIDICELSLAAFCRLGQCSGSGYIEVSFFLLPLSI